MHQNVPIQSQQMKERESEGVVHSFWKDSIFFCAADCLETTGEF